MGPLCWAGWSAGPAQGPPNITVVHALALLQDRLSQVACTPASTRMAPSQPSLLGGQDSPPQPSMSTVEPLQPGRPAVCSALDSARVLLPCFETEEMGVPGGCYTYPSCCSEGETEVHSWVGKAWSLRVKTLMPMKGRISGKAKCKQADFCQGLTTVPGTQNTLCKC